jgi:hypothetical protein
MPANLKKLRTTGLVFINHTCETCGNPAYFGVGVSFRRALNAFVAERHKEGQELLGKWYCGEHYESA